MIRRAAKSTKLLVDRETGKPFMFAEDTDDPVELTLAVRYVPAPPRRVPSDAEKTLQEIAKLVRKFTGKHVFDVHASKCPGCVAKDKLDRLLGKIAKGER